MSLAMLRLDGFLALELMQSSQRERSRSWLELSQVARTWSEGARNHVASDADWKVVIKVSLYRAEPAVPTSRSTAGAKREARLMTPSSTENSDYVHNLGKH